jgi:hypothetical protein
MLACRFGGFDGAIGHRVHMQFSKLSLIILIICLAGLLWILPLIILPAPTQQKSIAANGLFSFLILSGAFYALRRHGAGE